MTIFSLVAIASLMSGTLLHLIGWDALNLAALPFLLLLASTAIWLKLGYLRRQPPGSVTQQER